MTSSQHINIGLKDRSKLGEYCNCPFCLQAPEPHGTKGVSCMTSGCALNGLYFSNHDWNKRADILPARRLDSPQMPDELRGKHAWFNSALEEVARRFNIEF